MNNRRYKAGFSFEPSSELAISLVPDWSHSNCSRNLKMNRACFKDNLLLGTAMPATTGLWLAKVNATQSTYVSDISIVDIDSSCTQHPQTRPAIRNCYTPQEK